MYGADRLANTPQGCWDHSTYQGSENVLTENFTPYKACLGLRELSMNFPPTANCLSNGRLRYWLHYAAKFRKARAFSEALYIVRKRT